ncbi:hypothetical protein FF38_03712 [Lucilia cuprina]|uniref:Uncharacterized protein n=1 Tax=Lucilia cuprina TaxID=7375 RepID=A0A0L0BXT3_LUCCU|nr:hypothetical protein FF38_03712 [Lucilia cuprina]
MADKNCTFCSKNNKDNCLLTDIVSSEKIKEIFNIELGPLKCKKVFVCVNCLNDIVAFIKKYGKLRSCLMKFEASRRSTTSFKTSEQKSSTNTPIKSESSNVAADKTTPKSVAKSTQQKDSNVAAVNPTEIAGANVDDMAVEIQTTLIINKKK